MSEPSPKVTIDVCVNGLRSCKEVEPRMLLVEFLRRELGLTGTHVGCETSYCGACTVLLNGSPVKSCTLFAFQADQGEILTVEGLESQDGLHPLQRSFSREHGLQCGYCTPGMLMSSYSLLQEKSDPSESEIRKAIAGNVCRCTGYQNIVRAVRTAAQEMKEN